MLEVRRLSDLIAGPIVFFARYFVTVQVGSNIAKGNTPNDLPRVIGPPTADDRPLGQFFVVSGQWSVVGGQTAVPVTDKASNGCDVELWLSSYNSRKY